MKIEVGKRDGYTISYDPQKKEFILTDLQREDVATSESQEQLEKQIPDLIKQALKLPVAGLIERYGRWQTGRITSVNIGDRSAWFSFDNKSRQHAEKVNLNHSEIYAITPKNQTVIEKIQEHAQHIKDLTNQIVLLEKELESPIDLQFFVGRSGEST